MTRNTRRKPEPSYTQLGIRLERYEVEASVDVNFYVEHPELALHDSADDPLFDWAQTAGIPREWIALAWWAFEARYESDPKTYADWRAVFRRAVREDWLRLWRKARTGGWELTTAGEGVRCEMESPRV